jgi:hypothetical protein
MSKIETALIILIIVLAVIALGSFVYTSGWF